MSDSKAGKVPDDRTKDVYYSIEYVVESIASFRKMDKDNNGSLSLEELKAAYKEEKDPKDKMSDQDFDDLFKSLDFDSNKKVTADEFILFDMAVDGHYYDYEYAIVV